MCRREKLENQNGQLGPWLNTQLQILWLFSAAPMQIVTVAGVFMLFMAFVLGIQTLVKFFMGHAVVGFTTVILLLLIIGSIVMISLGIIGYYISKIYEEVKGRPKYLVSKKIGGK